MRAYELTFLGRTRLHEHRDAVALYFRVMRGGRYMGAYAGAVAGPDLVCFEPKPSRAFWAALAHVSANAIGVRLLTNPSPVADLDVTETIWIKPADIRAHMDAPLPLPVEDEVFRTFDLDDDPFHDDRSVHTRILSVGSSSISLKAAATRIDPADL